MNAPSVDDMATLIRRLARALQKVAPGHDLSAKALAYLERQGLKAAVLRDVGQKEGVSDRTAAQAMDRIECLVAEHGDENSEVALRALGHLRTVMGLEAEHTTEATEEEMSAVAFYRRNPSRAREDLDRRMGKVGQKEGAQDATQPTRLTREQIAHCVVMSQDPVAMGKVSVEQWLSFARAIEDFVRAAALTQQPSEQGPVAWQWRRKNEPWTLARTFNWRVSATTEDSEVRALCVCAHLAAESPREQS